MFDWSVSVCIVVLVGVFVGILVVGGVSDGCVGVCLYVFVLSELADW